MSLLMLFDNSNTIFGIIFLGVGIHSYLLTVIRNRTYHSRFNNLRQFKGIWYFKTYTIIVVSSSTLVSLVGLEMITKWVVYDGTLIIPFYFPFHFLIIAFILFVIANLSITHFFKINNKLDSIKTF